MDMLLLRRNARNLCFLVQTMLVVDAPLPGHAADLALARAHGRFTAIDEDVRDAIRQFAGDVRIPVNVSDAVTGRIHGRISADTPSSFLDLVSSSFGLNSYYDGYTLYMTADSENVSRTVRVPPESMDAFLKGLDSSGISDKRFILRPLPDQASVLVSGPPHYVDLVSQAASSLSPAASTAVADAPSTMVYRGASAQRTTFDGR